MKTSKPLAVILGLSTVLGAGCQVRQTKPAPVIMPAIVKQQPARITAKSGANIQPATTTLTSSTGLTGSTVAKTAPITGAGLSAAGLSTTPATPATPAVAPTGQPATMPMSEVKVTILPSVTAVQTPNFTTGPSTAPVSNEGNEIRKGNVIYILKPVLVTTQSWDDDTPRVNLSESGTPIASLPTPKLTLSDLKRVDSSLSTAPLVRMLAMKFNNVAFTRFAGFGAVDAFPTIPEGAEPDALTNEILNHEASGASSAIKKLIKGDVDFILITRAPTNEELNAAEMGGTRLRSDVVASEALVFTVNTNNPVGNISIERLRAIFTGEAKEWKDIGGEYIPLAHPIASKPITLAYRSHGTGTEELMSQILLEGKPMPEMPVSAALNGTKLVLDASTEDPETIGFSVFCYTANLPQNANMKVLSINGIKPEPLKVAAGEYPLTTPLFVVTRHDMPTSSNLAQLRQWLLAMPGQKALAEAGYMPMQTSAWTAARLMGK